LENAAICVKVKSQQSIDSASVTVRTWCKRG